MKKIFLAVFLILQALGPINPALAWFHSSSPGPIGGGTTGGGVQLINPLGQNSTFLDIANRIIDFLFTIAIPLTAILVLVGGFQMITAGGDPQKFSAGKKTILYAAIGFAVVLLAKSVVPIIQGFIGAPTTGSGGTTGGGTIY